MKVDDIADTEFLPEEVVDRFKFREENQQVLDTGGRPAQGQPVLLGIHEGVALDGLVHLSRIVPARPREC